MSETFDDSLVQSLTVKVYDSVIFISDEVRYIWNQSWSFGKAIYLVARYSCFIDASPVLWFSYTTILEAQMTTALASKEKEALKKYLLSKGIQIIRTYAIWNRNIIVLTYLLLVQFVGAVIGVFDIIKSFKPAIFVPAAPIVNCAIITAKNDVFVMYCFVLGTELNIVILSLIRGISHWRRESSKLIQTLYRDETVSNSNLIFAKLVAISFLNVLFTLKPPESPLFYVVMLPHRVFHSILASRIILNVRKVSLGVEHTSRGNTAGSSFRFRGREKTEESVELSEGVYSRLA
ncbi:hypothetical protein SCHPADRAFT_978962 [Schizopora paradoxa]|uniref:DUF6533 domain-containing protein n=1 Tax=Schizopora paradoxa TaxID=27342 RepID=A0A0H2RK14_9AGAM|nr:hypothetical protein SCHPADRAFT_978962 [Schizopora paradoxa]